MTTNDYCWGWSSSKQARRLLEELLSIGAHGGAEARPVGRGCRRVGAGRQVKRPHGAKRRGYTNILVDKLQGGGTRKWRRILALPGATWRPPGTNAAPRHPPAS